MTALLPSRRPRPSRPDQDSSTDSEPIGALEGSPDAVGTQGPGETGRAARRKVLRERFLTWLPLVLVLVGVAVLLYPVMATQHNNDEQQRLAEMYTASVDSAGPEAVAAERASAET